MGHHQINVGELKQERRRIANGKSGAIVDQSMITHVMTDKTEEVLREPTAVLDLTDKQNDEFVYAY